ncbi:hypothetical protein [Streptomyces niveus]|uniref:hypothetical protein n=1 Tax=Streptomyces niveus TaxID=193462 RepID=UPI003F4DCB7D
MKITNYGWSTRGCGLRAAEAKGIRGGRRPAVAAEKTGTVRTAYREGRSIAALARDHNVSRGAIRTASADLPDGPTHVRVRCRAVGRVTRRLVEPPCGGRHPWSGRGVKGL